MSKHRDKHNHDEHIDESWLIPYADLLTLLLALFIILFASSQVDSQKYEAIMQSLKSAFTGGNGMFEPSNVIPVLPNPGSENTETERQQNLEEEQYQEQLRKEQQDLEELRQKLESYIADNHLSTQLETKLTQDMLMLTIRDHALFASGSATIKPEARELGVVIAEMLSQYPEYMIEVAGHTDNVPISTSEFETNWDLSNKRALNFMKILLRNSSINESRFRAAGYGEFQPIDTNDTAEGRAKNRRVEVNILRSTKAPEPVSVKSS